MQNVAVKPQVSVFDVGFTFSHISSKPYFAKEFLEDLIKADVLLLPSENVREGIEYIYPETASDFWFWMKSKEKQGFHVEIAVNDEEFTMLSLKSNMAPLPTIFAKESVLPELTELIADYMDTYVDRLHKDAEDVLTVVNIFVDRIMGNNCKIMYQGTAEDLRESLREALKEMKP